MAKRKSLNKRSSRYSRGSGGSNVLNPDTNVFDDEQPYWWRNLENNTIAIPPSDSTNFNQTSRRLNSNSSIETNYDPVDGWWKILEGTSRNLKSLEKDNVVSKKDANDGASSISESEEVVKITKKKPHLRSEAKKVDGNAFLSALKDLKVELIPLEKEISSAQKFVSSSRISNDSKKPNKDSDTKRRMTEHGNDLSNCPLPKATSTPLESSVVSQETSSGNSNSDTEPVLKKKKPKTKLLRRHNIDTKKNLFENILMEDKTSEEEASHRPSAYASAVVDKSAKELEPRNVEDKSKLENANNNLHPTEKADDQIPVSNSSDTSCDFPEPMKPKSRFLRQMRRTPRENLFQKILNDSDSSVTKTISDLSPNRKSTRTMRRSSVNTAVSNEDMNLRLSSSSNFSDVDIIRTGNSKVSSPQNSHVENASSQPEDRISTAVKTSRERSILLNDNEKSRNVSRIYQTQLYSDSDEEENDKASDVTLLTTPPKSSSVKTRVTILSDVILTQPKVSVMQKNQKNLPADEEAVASLTKGSVEIKDTTVTEKADNASDIELRNLNRSRIRPMSRSAQEIVAEEAAMSQRTMKSQDHSGSANFNEDRTSSEAERSAQTSLRRQSKRSITAQQRLSFTESDEQTREPENTTPRRSKRSQAARRTSEMVNDRTPKRDSRVAVKVSESRNLNSSSIDQEIAAEKTTVSQRMMKSQKHSSPADFNENRTSSEAEPSAPTSPRRQSKRSITAQQRISSTANEEKTREPQITTPRRSKRSQAARRTSEMENVRTLKRDSRDAVKVSALRDLSSSSIDQQIAAEKTTVSQRMMKSQEHSSPADFNEDRTGSEAEPSARTFPRRQSKRSITAQQRLSFTESDEQTREPKNTTPIRSKRSQAARRTSEMENVRTPKRDSRVAVKVSEFRDLNSSSIAQEIAAEKTTVSQRMMKSQEHSSPADFNEDRTSSEAEPSARTSPRRQSKRSITAQQRLSFTESDEQTRVPENTTPRRSKRSQAARRTSEMEKVRTPKRDSRVAVKVSEFRDLNSSSIAQEIASEKAAVSQRTMKSQEHSSPADFNEDRTSSEVEPSARTSPRRQSKRSITAQQRISSSANEEKTREPEITTPRRSKRSEAARRTSEMENVRTPKRDSRVAVKVSEFRDLNSSSIDQEIAAEKTTVSQRMRKSQEHSSPADFNEDRTRSETERSARTSPRRQSKRSITAQQRISSTANDEKTREPENTTPRRSKRSEAARRTSETENVRTPERISGVAVKVSEFRDLNSSPSAQEITAEETAMSQRTMKSQEHSSAANFIEDRTSSETERSAQTSPRWQIKRSITVQQRISSTANDEKTREPENTAPKRSKRSEAARRTSETENVRTPERESRDAVEERELEGTLQSRRSLINFRETRKTPPLGRPGSSKARISAAPQRSQKVLEDFFKTSATAMSACQALSNPQIAQDIRKKLNEMKERELLGIEQIGKLPVVQKKKKLGNGLRPQSNKQNSVPKQVDKAYLVNGVLYKQPRLPRPKRWVTDLLYRYLWKQMEPKYKLETRVQSEKFVRRLSEVSDVIAKRKTYPTYKKELHALMKEMARLQIIRSRHDFYTFCQDFLPYELRAKMVPILLPGNQRTIPYDPNLLHEPLITP